LAQFPSRVHALRITWDGEILFDYMAHAPWASGNALAPVGPLERVSREVHFASGVHYQNALLPAFCAGVLLIPLLWKTRARRPLLLCLIALAVAWVQMAVTKDAGLSAHHIVLLWPLPHWFLAVAFVQAAAWRPLRWRHAGTVLLATVVVALAAENLLLTNEYFYQLAAFGPMKSWDDAIFRLSDEAGHIQSTRLVLDDWGILNPLVTLHRNRLPLLFADETFLEPGISQPMREWEQGFLDEVWIGHTDAFQQVPGTNARIVHAARTAGFEKRLIKTVADRNGRPVFEIFRFVQNRAP
jgi:hypothetical protein